MHHIHALLGGAVVFAAISSSNAMMLINPSFDDGLTGWSQAFAQEPGFGFHFPYVSGGTLTMYSTDWDATLKSVYQTFHAEAGTILNGSAIFYTEHSGYGWGTVTVNGTQIWRSTDPAGHFGDAATVGREFWQYVVPDSGLLTISFNMDSGCQHGQWVEFDGVIVTASAAVPDAGHPIGLGLVGLLGMAWFGLHHRKGN